MIKHVRNIYFYVLLVFNLQSGIFEYFANPLDPRYLGDNESLYFVFPDNLEYFLINQKIKQDHNIKDNGLENIKTDIKRPFGIYFTKGVNIVFEQKTTDANIQKASITDGYDSGQFNSFLNISKWFMQHSKDYPNYSNTGIKFIDFGLRDNNSQESDSMPLFFIKLLLMNSRKSQCSPGSVYMAGRCQKFIQTSYFQNINTNDIYGKSKAFPYLEGIGGIVIKNKDEANEYIKWIKIMIEHTDVYIQKKNIFSLFWYNFWENIFADYKKTKQRLYDDFTLWGKSLGEFDQLEIAHGKTIFLKLNKEITKKLFNIYKKYWDKMGYMKSALQKMLKPKIFRDRNFYFPEEKTDFHTHFGSVVKFARLLEKDQRKVHKDKKDFMIRFIKIKEKKLLDHIYDFNENKKKILNENNQNEKQKALEKNKNLKSKIEKILIDKLLFESIIYKALPVLVESKDLQGDEIDLYMALSVDNSLAIKLIESKKHIKSKELKDILKEIISTDIIQNPQD